MNERSDSIQSLDSEIVNKNFYINYTNTKQHYYAYDIMRILAIIFILYNHRYCYACTNIYDASIVYIFKVILSILAKTGPPLFFAVSGALLLGKNEDFTYILKHRILRIFIVMLLCTIKFMISTHDFSQPFNVFFTKLNWYLYAYIGYLFMLPFFRIIACNIKIEDAKLFIILTIIIYTLSGISLFFEFSQSFSEYLQLFTSAWSSNCWHIIFPLSAFFITLFINSNDNNSFIKFINIFSILSIILSCIGIIFTLKYNVKVETEMIRQFFIYAPTLSIFYCILTITNNNSISSNTKISKIITEVSRGTFCIYLIETNTEISSRIAEYIDLSLHFSTYINSIICVLCSFIIFSLIAYVIRRIPVVNKIL